MVDTNSPDVTIESVLKAEREIVSKQKAELDEIKTQIDSIREKTREKETAKNDLKNKVKKTR